MLGATCPCQKNNTEIFTWLDYVLEIYFKCVFTLLFDSQPTCISKKKMLILFVISVFIFCLQKYVSLPAACAVITVINAWNKFDGGAWI